MASNPKRYHSLGILKGLLTFFVELALKVATAHGQLLELMEPGTPGPRDPEPANPEPGNPGNPGTLIRHHPGIPVPVPWIPKVGHYLYPTVCQ